jgi:hypothetical protein
MYLQIPHLSIVENLTDLVDWSLYGPDPPRGGGSDGSISIDSGARGSWPPGPMGTSGSWELGPGSMMVVGT